MRRRRRGAPPLVCRRSPAPPHLQPQVNITGAYLKLLHHWAPLTERRSCEGSGPAHLHPAGSRSRRRPVMEPEQQLESRLHLNHWDQQNRLRFTHRGFTDNLMRKEGQNQPLLRLLLAVCLQLCLLRLQTNELSLSVFLITSRISLLRVTGGYLQFSTLFRIL